MRIVALIFSAAILLAACSDDKIVNPNGPDSPDNSAEIEGNPITASYDSRGMVVSYDIRQPDLNALVSWKWFKSDPDDVTYDIYRKVDGGTWEKLNEEPIVTSTNYRDKTFDPSKKNEYQLRFSGGSDVLATCMFNPDNAEQTFYKSIFLNNSNLPDPTLAYNAGDAAVGDLDGDGKYELVIRRDVEPRDPGPAENWVGKEKGSTLYEAYDLETGAFLWRVDTGINVPQGDHYASFIVYDLDGDGKAEVVLKTSEGTTFGDGVTSGDINQDGITDYRNPETGRVQAGPEFLSVVDGMTGKELARTDYIPRGDKEDWNDYWGDAYGNRSDRFLMAVAHFSGMDRTPSIVMCRGYYVNFQLTALDYSNGKLTQRWHFDTYPGWTDYAGQGNHNLAVGDIDNDGRDELIYGACAFDHNGKGLYTTGLGHGDALHLGKFDPSREGLQVVACHEEPASYRNAGLEFRDAATGELIWGIPGDGEDVGRCMVGDMDPDTPGCEVWASWPTGKMYSCKGELLSKSAPMIKGGVYSYNMGIWWDGTLTRQNIDDELVLAYRDSEGGDRVFSCGNYGVASINGTKRTPCFYGDIWGDWREEMIYVVGERNVGGASELRIFTTNIETNHRFRPLMDDHIYRMSATHQNIGYNQSTHTGYYIGTDLEKK